MDVSIGTKHSNANVKEPSTEKSKRGRDNEMYDVLEKIPGSSLVGKK